jgi:hypothetical protein
MKMSDMKNLIMEFLYKNKDVQIQFFNGMGINEEPCRFAEQKGINLDMKGDERIFRESFWELFSLNLVTPGSRNSRADKLPWVSITDYGIETFERGDKFPYDPEGFLDNLYSRIENLDPIIQLYFEEAISSFSHNDFLASTVMIGGALEKTILSMTENFKNIIENDDAEYERKVLNKMKIKARFDEFLKYLTSNDYVKKLDIAEREKLNSLFPAIVNLIRISRNEVGHPTGRQISRDEAQALILLTKEAIIFSYKLIDKLK